MNVFFAWLRWIFGGWRLQAKLWREFCELKRNYENTVKFVAQQQRDIDNITQLFGSLPRDLEEIRATRAAIDETLKKNPQVRVTSTASQFRKQMEKEPVNGI